MGWHSAANATFAEDQLQHKVLHMWAKMVSETDDRSQTASHCPSNRDVSCDILLKSLLELKLSDTFSSD